MIIDLFEIFLPQEKIPEFFDNTISSKVPEGFSWKKWDNDIMNISDAIRCIINTNNIFDRYYLIPDQNKKG